MDLDKDFSNQNYLAGVVGRAKNDSPNPAPAYGGVFYGLKAFGLFLNVETTSTSLTISGTQYFISCYNTSPINISLPDDNRHNGRVVFVKRVNSGVTIFGNGAQLVYKNNISSINIDDGECWMFVYDGNWIASQMS